MWKVCITELKSMQLMIPVERFIYLLHLHPTIPTNGDTPKAVYIILLASILSLQQFCEVG